MEIQLTEENSGTNCKSCERYGKLGDVCVVEHGKKFLWEFCKDFEAEIELPDYNELMQTVKQDLAAERKKLREKKQKEIAQRRKEREVLRKEKSRMKRSRIAKRVWRERRKKENSRKNWPKIADNQTKSGIDS
jgi:aspartyl/asparaginyl-tRNA synthetase